MRTNHIQSKWSDCACVLPTTLPPQWCDVRAPRCFMHFLIFAWINRPMSHQSVAFIMIESFFGSLFVDTWFGFIRLCHLQRSLKSTALSACCFSWRVLPVLEGGHNLLSGQSEVMHHVPYIYLRICWGLITPLVFVVSETPVGDMWLFAILILNILVSFKATHIPLFPKYSSRFLSKIFVGASCTRCDF